MKKIPRYLMYVLFPVILAVSFLAPTVTWAALGDPVPLDRITSPISAESNSAVDVSLTDKTINDTSASFNFSIKAKRSSTIILIIAWDTDPNRLVFDNSNLNAKRVIIHSDNIPVVGQVENVKSPPTLANLQPGTLYYFQIKDVANNVWYQKFSFSTTGTKPKPITVTLPTPTVTAGANNTYTATFNGTFKTGADMRVQLALYYGEIANSLTGPFIVFPEKLVTAGVQQQFEYPLPQLKSGTTYYYRIRDLISQTDVTEQSPFTTPGTAPQPQQSYNPNAPGSGALIENYKFPTNIGEPTGDLNEPVTDSDRKALVPCGKRSDNLDPNVIEPNENCSFKHIAALVQNVISFLMILLIPLTALACVYTGVQMILHRQMPAELLKYKDRLLKIVVGLLIMLLAYTIVAIVVGSILGDDATKYLWLKITP